MERKQLFNENTKNAKKKNAFLMLKIRKLN